MLRLLQICPDDFQPPAGLADPTLNGFLRLTVFTDHLIEKADHLFHRELPLSGFLRFRSKSALRTAFNTAQILADALLPVRARAIEFRGLPLEPVLEDLIVSCLEDLAEDLLALPGIREKELQEIALGDHGDLRELVPVDPEDLLYFGLDIGISGDHPAVGEQQFRAGLPGRKARAGLLGAVLFGISLYRVFPAAVNESQADLRGRLRRGVLGAEHAGIARLPARLAVQRICDAVKDRRLTRPGVPGDEIEPAPAQFVKIHDRMSRIRPEGGHFQSYRSHFSSQIFSMISLAKASCSSLIGRPFCCS